MNNLYSELARTFADARSSASSISQLAMLDKVVHMVADTLSEFNKFNKDRFLQIAKPGFGIPFDFPMEE